MRRVARCSPILCAALLLAGCEGAGDRGADTLAADTGAAAPAAAPMPAPAGISLATVAGRWNMRSVPESGTDTSATEYVLEATTSTGGWTITFPNREPIPTRVVAVEGDSIVVEAGPFESARRQGMQVSTHSVFRMQNDRLAGTTVARYVTTGPDSVLRLRSEGTRAP